MFNNKELDAIGEILYYIDCCSGFKETSSLIECSSGGSFEVAVANIKSGAALKAELKSNAQNGEQPFDLYHHGGAEWLKEAGGWAGYANRQNLRRVEYIQKFFDYIETNNVQAPTVFKALQKWEKEHFHSGFPWGLPYARVFLNKWRSYSW